MIGIKYNGKFIELGDSKMTLTLKTPFITGPKDEDIVPGIQSLPFTIPLTAHNRELLNYPHRIDNESLLIQKESVDVYYMGKFMYEGKLYLKGANSKTAKGYVIVNELKNLGDTKLSELDLGVVTFGADLTATLAHAKDTAVNPLNYDYIFFPIYNATFFNEDYDTVPPFRNHQNYWDFTNQKFLSHRDQQTAMPFIRVDFLLTKIFDHIGYSLDNKFQINDELKKMVIYNNHSIYKDLDNWSENTELSNHLPGSKAVEFVKGLRSMFGLAVTYDQSDVEFTIEPLKDVINADPKRNWTKYVSSDHNLSTEQNKTGSFEWSYDPGDEFNEISHDNAYAGIVQETLEFETDMDTMAKPKGVYFIYSTTRYIDFDPARTPKNIVLGSAQRFYEIDSDVDPVICKLQPLNTAYDDNKNEYYPRLSQMGTSRPNDFSNTDYEARVTFYREMYTDGAITWPLASHNNYEVIFGQTPVKVWDYSMEWTGPYGLYEIWWKDWHYFLKNAKTVTFKLNLPIAEYLNFKFSDKIRIGSMNYMVKELKVNFSGGNILEVDAILMTTL